MCVVRVSDLFMSGVEVWVSELLSSSQFLLVGGVPFRYLGRSRERGSDSLVLSSVNKLWSTVFAAGAY